MANKWELLAPAGGMEALRAALANGADAVYLGAAAFGARASAGFNEADLENALALAHLHRKKVYVTVNIAVKEGELAALRDTLSRLSRLGADAVLVQDLGALRICREEFPQLPVHASTQMALHNAAGARLLMQLGARRVVLARECDLDAIRAAAETGLEIEAFCHGALCVSASGQCLFSSMIGGRSGNRGRCAQPCRLPYIYQGKTGAWLSPRDLCARNELAQMARAGVYSFKIEGRLKRPEYVAVVTRVYRDALDALAEGRFVPADTEEKEALAQIFSRGGFTSGYPGPGRDAAIIDPTRVSPAGLPLGRVTRVYPKGSALLADTRLLRPLHNGDGLEIGAQGLRYSGPDVEAGETAALRLRERVKPGEAVRRTEDESQLSAARATYEGEALNAALPIPITGTLTAYPGKPLTLEVTDGESRAMARGEACQMAENKPLEEEAARRALGKTGGTPFVLEALRVDGQNAFVPAAALNALRREALDKLAAARIAAQPRPALEGACFAPPDFSPKPPRILARTEDISQVPWMLKAGADEILYAPRDYREAALRPVLQALPGKARLCLPAQCRQETLGMLRRLTAEYRVPVCVGSLGQLGLFSENVMAGEGIPVMNGETVRMLAYLGCAGVTLSREMSRGEIEELPAGPAELILPVYGRTRLMVLNHCPMRTAMGLHQGREHCDLCRKGKGAEQTTLTDRLRASYPLIPVRLPEGCLIGLWGDRPLHLSQGAKGLGRASFLLGFTQEDEATRRGVIAHYAALLRGKTPPPLAVRGTMGRFLEGVQ